MSFDLQLKNGDIVLGANADFSLVSKKDKLVQDVIKHITTPQGSNIFQKTIGSLVNKRLIGKNLDYQTSIGVIQSSIQEALLVLQKLQKQQATYQALSPAETLVSIESIAVKRDSSDPRQLNVTLTIKSADGNLTPETIAITMA